MQTIALMLLTADEIEIIKSQGEWTDDYMTYKLPPFYFKQKKLNFPKLPVLQGNNSEQKQYIFVMVFLNLLSFLCS
jgi:hypothetical protein